MVVSSLSLLKMLVVASAVLVLWIYFLYLVSSFPTGREAIACLLSFVTLLTTVVLLTIFQNTLSSTFYRKAVSFGNLVGLLWTIEIGINNFAQPGLPLRDIVDNLFWAIIACLILGFAVRESFKSRKISSGIRAGFLSGFSSGVIACLTALVLICFGMPFLLKDTLNVVEWNAVKSKTHYPAMAAYFAYQTLAGAMMHLIVLGGGMGLLLGIIGGFVGKLAGRLKKS